MSKEILELLGHLEIVEASLNGNIFNSITVQERNELLLTKFIIKTKLSQYSKEEIEQAKNLSLNKNTTRKIFIEEIEQIKKEERGLLWTILMTYIIMSESKNKLFYMIAIDLFAKDVKYENKITIREVNI